jgi:hypothetical protein
MISPIGIATKGLLGRHPVSVATRGYIYATLIEIQEEQPSGGVGGGGGGSRISHISLEKLHQIKMFELSKAEEKDILSIIQIFVRCQADHVS